MILAEHLFAGHGTQRTIYLFIYSLFILGLLSKKNMMPSGNLRLSQETLTRTHHSTGYKKQGHLPSGCSRCPSCSNCSHNCGTCPRGSSFHSSVSLFPSLPDFVAGDTTESSVGFGLQVLKQKQKDSIFVLSDELKDSHLHALAIKNIMMMIATNFH